ncbi:eaee59cb-a35b-40f6-8080-2870591d6caa [Sclerotinia trifoliorum]|uniref:Eaee59cb-a35b-40f6-8080-2870591d6caa n=1 Tax=Sclerotinia trifoliorum TaxID=28548 RepID=A0A8H2W3Z9_9HELO|nr:eaee59cb-a35b-40f6-8080-2870591d6caa [Sclerotinia trifoliorum]
MKLNFLSTALAVGLVSARAHYQQEIIVNDTEGQWIAPTATDYRGPCPMLNTLANHGFLPRDGRNLTEYNLVKGLKHGLNFNKSLSSIMFQQGVFSSPAYPNTTFFTLDDLNRHNILEHDASISRSDAYFGNNHVFNQTIFDTTKKYWPSETLTAQHLVNGKIFRQVVSRTTNPNYTFTSKTQSFSIGEIAAPIIAFGDKNALTANRTLVENWIESERLPTELGWSKPKEEVTLSDILYVTGVMANLTSLLSDAVITPRDGNTGTHAKRMGHWGVSM